MGRGSLSRVTDFMNLEQDRVVSFARDAAGLVSFQVLIKFQPLEFEGLQPVYWRKIHRSEAYPSKEAAFAAARERFAWIEAAWQADLAI